MKDAAIVRGFKQMLMTRLLVTWCRNRRNDVSQEDLSALLEDSEWRLRKKNFSLFSEEHGRRQRRVNNWQRKRSRKRRCTRTRRKWIDRNGIHAFARVGL